jgi:hypothetical protein
MIDKKSLFILVLIQILFSSCSNRLFQHGQGQVKSNPTVESVIYNFSLLALDLTEDVSRISTKNDELVILLYRDTLSQECPDLIYQDYFIIDSLKTKKSFVLYDSLKYNSNLTFVFIEVDTKKSLTQIETLVGINLEDISKAQLSGNSKFLSQLLGDDDLIGIKKISTSDLKNKSVVVDFKGIRLFDPYHYQLEIKIGSIGK